MSLHVRLAERDELTVVYGIMKAAFAPTALEPHPSSALRESIDDVVATAARGGAILAVLDGEAAGSGRFTADLGAGFLSYERLAVLPSLQGHGIGSAMIDWLEDHARSIGAREIRVCARSREPDNRPYYLARGYEIVGYSERYGIPDIRTHLRKPL